MSNTNWFGKLKQGLSKTSNAISTKFTQIFINKKLDDNIIEEFSDLLLSADLGAKTTDFITNELRKQKFGKEVSVQEIKDFMFEIMHKILENKANPIELKSSPHVIILCGVNGNGKTTTAAKLANYYMEQNKKVLIAACDTFRAGATEQLEEWCERINCPIVTTKIAETTDPAAVAFKSMQRAIGENFDILIVDTAGRLHTHNNLMEELAKIKKVIAKLNNDTPNDIILVLDGTTGQNAFRQISEFKKIIDINGLIVTKLDGTTKAGIIIGLARDFDISIRAIGVGEKIDDLKPFSAEEFCHSILDYT